MDAPATLVWIAPEPPDPGARKALASWASTHGTRLADPPDWRPTALAIDAGVAAEVDDLLDRARDALAADDGADVDGALARADALLRTHAELPQAAWLMAEVERTRAVRWRRVAPVDVEAAARAWKRADALDGGRATSIAELDLGGRAPAASVDVVAPLRGSEHAWIDGRRVAGRVETGAGLHAAVVTWSGAPVWAEWREIPPGPSSMTLDAPRALPCSSVDVAAARLDGGRVAGDGVQCPSWVAALPLEGSARGLRVAVCAGDRCGPLVEWLEWVEWVERPVARPWVERRPAVAVIHEGRWPAWATWSVVGAGAAVAAGAAVLLSNALRTPPAETRFVTGGIQRE